MKNLHTANMIRNPRLNGYLKTMKVEKSLHVKSKPDFLTDNGLLILSDEQQLKFEQIHNQIDETKPLPLHSIIGISNEDKHQTKTKKPRQKKPNKFGPHHETLQRIECVRDDQFNHYQKHWFSAGLERLKIEDRSREERLEITRYELKRHLKQLMRANVGRGAELPQLFEWRDVVRRHARERRSRGGGARMVRTGHCDADGCEKPALPCARQCTLHILRNPNQVLFTACTAKFADNTQCSVPMFDVLHELPLCIEHARKRDNYKLYQDAKPKKIRKKPKPSAMIRPQKRTKKKKKPVTMTTTPTTSTALLPPPPPSLHPTTAPLAARPPPPLPPSATSSALASITATATIRADTVVTPALPAAVAAYMDDETIETIAAPSRRACSNNMLAAAAEITDDLMTDVHVHADSEEALVNDDDMVSQVLALQGPDALGLATVDQVLVNQASHLLEETDITNVLNTIQADEFNDFFTVNRNGDYEPSREETEELERALAAVDNDVKSLEKLSQSQGLLDNFLDDHMVESFVQSSIVSDVFHNGFSSCGENIMVGQTSRLLSVQQNNS